MTDTPAVEIPLTRGMVALVSPEDYGRVCEYKWFAQSASGLFYAGRIENKKTILLHRYIMNARQSQVIDHRNGDTLDCRQENLRFATTAQNHHNQRCKPGKFKGVWLDKRDNRWYAQITFDGMKHCLGRFQTPEEGARAYDKAAVRFFGEFARLNFPA